VQIEVELMTTQSRSGYSQGRVIDVHTGLLEAGTDLDNYLLKSTQELNAITELANRGEVVDRDSRDWMLTQVDFIVETIGDDSLDLDDEMRSNLLQLLLAIANLNEQIRSQASLNL
jgi:hypothetical protein